MNIQRKKKELENLTTRELVKNVLVHKLEDDLIFDILREKGIEKFKIQNLGQIYTIPEHQSKTLDKKSLSEYLGEKIEEFERITNVKQHYCRKLK